MKKFAKAAAFVIFGVIFSPIMFGMFAPIIVWNMTNSVFAVVIATVVLFSVWAVAREWMINRKWHYHI